VSRFRQGEADCLKNQFSDSVQNDCKTGYQTLTAKCGMQTQTCHRNQYKFFQKLLSPEKAHGGGGGEKCCGILLLSFSRGNPSDPRSTFA